MNDENGGLDPQTLILCSHRLQPIHRGHVDFWRELRQRFDNPIAICILRNDQSGRQKAEANRFMEMSLESFNSERNPLDDWSRLWLTSQAIANDELLAGNSIALLRTPPHVNWQMSLAGLPENRIWAINTSAEPEFGKTKEKFYIENGENVMTFPFGRPVGLSGQTIRSDLLAGITDLSFLPPGCEEFFSKYCQSAFSKPPKEISA